MVKSAPHIPPTCLSLSTLPQRSPSAIYNIDIGIIKGRCLITISQSADDAFDLHYIHGIVHFNKQYPCVVVPDYVKEELLDTLASYKA